MERWATEAASRNHRIRGPEWPNLRRPDAPAGRCDARRRLGTGLIKMLVDLAVAATVALVVSVMTFSLASMFRPQWLAVMEPLICTPGTTLELRNASPVPGELVLEAWCICDDTERDVTRRFVFTAIGLLFVPVMLTVFAARSLRGIRRDRRLRRGLDTVPRAQGTRHSARTPMDSGPW